MVDPKPPSSMEINPIQTTWEWQRMARRSQWAVRFRRRVAFGMLIVCALISLVVTFLTVTMLVVESSKFFLSPEVSVVGFLTQTRWTIGQTQGEIHYGIGPLVLGTLRVSGIGLGIALPIGLLSAIYLSEYATPARRSFLKPVLEVLSGVPTVVLGFFAVTLFTPYLLASWGDFKPFNATSAGIAVGILCLPLVTTLVEDALQMVPRRLRDAGHGMGATRMEVTLRVVLPAAYSGILSAFLLGAARAFGETMVVALAAGSAPVWTLDPRAPSQTMTGYILETIISDSVVPGSITYHSIYAVAAVLFLLTLCVTILGQWLRQVTRRKFGGS